jgi:hypothetical protein
LEGSVRDLSEVLYLHFLGGTEENHRISVRRAGVQTKTRAGYLLNTNLEHYHQNDMFGELAFKINIDVREQYLLNYTVRLWN